MLSIYDDSAFPSSLEERAFTVQLTAGDVHHRVAVSRGFNIWEFTPQGWVRVADGTHLANRVRHTINKY